MRTIPTFIVGHMSGENWDPAWRAGTRPLPRRLAGLAAGVVRRRDRAALRRPPRGLRLARLERDAAVRRARRRSTRSPPGRGSSSRRSGRPGRRQPISLGDGAWGVEVTGADNGYSLRALAPLVDFVGPHSYPMQDDELRQLLSRPRSRASSRAASASPSCSRSSASAPTSRPTRTPPPTTGRCCTRPCSPARAAGSPGTTATTTTCATRTRTATTSSSSTSASPTRPGGRRSSSRRWRRSPTLVRELAVDGWEPVSGEARDRRARALRARAALHRPGLPPGHPRPAPAVVRRRARGRPPRRASSASATGSRTDARLLPRPVREAADRPRHRPAAQPRARRRDASTSRTSRAAPTNQRGPWLSWLRRDLRCRAPAPVRARRPDRGRRGRLRARRGPRRAHDGDAALVHGRRRAVGARATSRSSPSGADIVADRQLRPSGAPSPPRSAPARRSSAPIPSSTWRPGHPGRTPRTRGASTRRSPPLAGVERRVRVDDPRVLAGIVAGRHTRRRAARQLLLVCRLARAGRRTRRPATGRLASRPRATRRGGVRARPAGGRRRRAARADHPRARCHPANEGRDADVRPAADARRDLNGSARRPHHTDFRLRHPD